MSGPVIERILEYCLADFDGDAGTHPVADTVDHQGARSEPLLDDDGIPETPAERDRHLDGPISADGVRDRAAGALDHRVLRYEGDLLCVRLGPRARQEMSLGTHLGKHLRVI